MPKNQWAADKNLTWGCHDTFFLKIFSLNKITIINSVKSKFNNIP